MSHGNKRRKRITKTLQCSERTKLLRKKNENRQQEQNKIRTYR